MSPAARPLRPAERALVAYLLDLAGIGGSLSETLVTEMDDGNMGSLSFQSAKPHHAFGRVASACSFADADGVPVEAALLLDRDGDAFELDLWRVDFAPLLRILELEAFRPVDIAEGPRSDGDSCPAHS